MVEEEEIKVNVSGNIRIREDEEDPDIAEREDAIPDIDKDNDGISNTKILKNQKKLFNPNKNLILKIYKSKYLIKS